MRTNGPAAGLQRNIYLLIGGGILSWGALLSLIFLTSPRVLGIVGIILCVFLAGMAVASTISLIGFYARLFYTRNESLFKNFVVSVRQGILIGSYCSIILVFSYLRVNSLLTSVLLLIALLFFELFLRGESS